MGWNLTADHHHRNAVHVSSRNTGYRIGDAGPRCDQRNTDIARGTRVAIGRVNSCLLVAHQNVLDGILLIKSVVNVQHCTAWVTPHVFDVFGLQGLDKNLCPAEFRVIASLCRSGL